MLDQEVIKEESIGFLMIQYKQVLEHLQLLTKENWRLKKVKNTSLYFERGYRVQYSYCMIPMDMFTRNLEIKARQQDWKRIGTWKHLLIFGKEELDAKPLIEDDTLLQYIKTSHYVKEDFYRVFGCFLVSALCFLLALWFVVHSAAFIAFFFLSLLWGGMSLYHLWVLLHVSHCIYKPEYNYTLSIEQAEHTMQGVQENMIVGGIATILILIVG